MTLTNRTSSGHSAFDPASLAALDEPVRRYFMHAIRPGAALGHNVRRELQDAELIGLD